MHPRLNSNETNPDRIRYFIKQFLFGAFLCVAMAVPAKAELPQFPALVDPATQEQHTGKVIFTELVTPDLTMAKQFYARLFGWKFRDMQDGKTEYAEAFLHGYPVAGLIHKPIPAGEHRQPAWLTFISTDDVDATEKLALQNGAKLLFGPRDVPLRGREAVLADPQGAVFAILDSSSGDPADVLPMPGEWIWSSLITRDPDTDAAFYQTLFDYEVFDLSPDNSAQHLLLSSDNYARASVNVLPTSRADSHPHWLNYVRVRNTDRMAAKVVKLGGRVLVEPRVDRHGGKIAVVADPTGAPFGLIEWPDADNKKVTQ